MSHFGPDGTPLGKWDHPDDSQVWKDLLFDGLDGEVVPESAEVEALRAKLEGMEEERTLLIREHSKRLKGYGELRDNFEVLAKWCASLEAANRNLVERSRKLESMTRLRDGAVAARDMFRQERDDLQALVEVAAEAAFTGAREKRYYELQSLLRPAWNALEERRREIEEERRYDS